MATSKPNNIDETQMAQVMKDLGISSEVLTKEIMDVMINRVKQSAIETSWTVGEVSIDI